MPDIYEEYERKNKLWYEKHAPRFIGKSPWTYEEILEREWIEKHPEDTTRKKVRVAPHGFYCVYCVLEGKKRPLGGKSTSSGYSGRIGQENLVNEPYHLHMATMHPDAPEAPYYDALATPLMDPETGEPHHEKPGSDEIVIETGPGMSTGAVVPKGVRDIYVRRHRRRA